jgi:predicted component of type VI protein secretion system
MASLIIISGKQTGEFLPLGSRTSVIGRAESLPLQILDDKVSRKHLRIRFDKGTGKYYAEDMSSKHGVLTNGRKISGEAVLVDGDQILIGQPYYSQIKTSKTAKVRCRTSRRSASECVLHKLSERTLGAE